MPDAPPSLDLLTASQARTVGAVLDDLTASGFDPRALRPQVPELRERLAAACASADDRGRMVKELDRWVRWRRLPGYWLAYLFQLGLQQRGSADFAAGCLLYADAQINANSDLCLPSLENGYNALANRTEPPLPELAASIAARMRMVFASYRAWYSSTPYTRVNPLTEHLYGEKTWGDLAGAFEALRRPRRELAPAAYLEVIERCDASNDTYHGVLARRFLGSLYEGLGQLDRAAQQLQLALDAAGKVGLDAELGHLHRLHGHVLRSSGDLDGADRELQRAYAHEAHPLFAYWRALSARELGDVALRRLPRMPDAGDLPRLPKEQLSAVLRWYGIARDLFDRHVAACVVPVARAIEQQMFRSYVDNAIQIAVAAGQRDALAELEASGPRYATDVIAEGRAASALGADAFSEYMGSRATFHEHLAVFGPQGLDRDFEQYLGHVRANRQPRQLYMRTRLQLTAPITEAQLSDVNAARLLEQRLPDVAFLFFHVARQETYSCLLFPGAGMPVGRARRASDTWHACDRAFQDALQKAHCPPGPPPHPSPIVSSALDTLLESYGECFRPFLEPFLPALTGKQLKVFPRFSMNAVPFHALRVNGRFLVEHCDVSYGQTIGMLRQVHREAASSGPASVAAVYDEAGTVAYRGMFRALDARGARDVSRLPVSSWQDARAALEACGASDLLFACHGQYDREDPARSSLRLRSGTNVSFSEVFSRLDLRRCRSVTLGACESGVARTLVSAEYIGLPVAFLAAGAQYVIATLWQVNQVASAILLGHFYGLLLDGGHTVVAALNEAQRATMRMPRAAVLSWVSRFLPEKVQGLGRAIQELDDPPFAHPYYWAGFYVAGDV